MSKMSIDIAKFAPTRLPPIRQTLSGDTMGTRYSSVFYTLPGTNVAALNAALFAAVDRVDRQMSTWRADSDLNKLNAAPIGTWMNVPNELLAVLSAALSVERLSTGAFNINVGDLVSAWGFGPSQGAANSGQLSHAGEQMRRPASASLELDLQNRRARKSEMINLDLSGIAKGFGVDEMARVMDAFGVPSWLVGIDGEMRAKGRKRDGSLWAVAHERPDRHMREAMGVIELQDMAVATSGNYRHFREVGGRTVSHTMSPRTGTPLQSEIASVTVLASRCMIADAWATALMVMGVEAGLEAAQVQGIDVIFVLQDGSVRSSL